MKEITEPLLNWFKKNKRDLEWRKDSSAYSILVSEIMLQQTKAQAVRPYYIRFIQELPNFEALANCDDEKLLKLWEGLGYYSRARNLKNCAKQIINRHNGEFPKNYDEAIQLSGIGDYTCGAVLSRAYNLKYAAVDGNVLRVLSRYMASPLNISSATTKTIFKKQIEKILPQNPGIFNEALMELGATICMPKVILCDQCPIHSTCKSFLKQTQHQYPIKNEKKEKKILEYTCIFITDNQKYIFTPKPDGVLKDMPAPFLIPSFIQGKEALDFVDNMGLQALREIKLPEKRHIFTHQIWYMKAYKIIVKRLGNYPAYTEQEIINNLGISTCFKQFLKDLFTK